jgi:DNA-directed RNA polymerase specialized sigma24 family protein
MSALAPTHAPTDHPAGHTSAASPAVPLTDAQVRALMEAVTALGVERKRLQAADAADLYQDALLALVRLNARGVPFESVRSQAGTVTANLVSLFFRVRGRQQRLARGAAEVCRRAGDAAEFAAADARLDAPAVLARLPARQRAVVRERAGGATQAQTAAALGWSRAAVQRSLRAADATARRLCGEIP